MKTLPYSVETTLGARAYSKYNASQNARALGVKTPQETICSEMSSNYIGWALKYKRDGKPANASRCAKTAADYMRDVQEDKP